MATKESKENDNTILLEMGSLSVSTRLIHGDNNRDIRHLDSSSRDGGLSPMISTAKFEMYSTLNINNYIKCW